MLRYIKQSQETEWVNSYNPGARTGRWHHNIRKFVMEIFQNVQKSAADLCQILRIDTIYIVINSTHV